jgi:uncharacterized surface protein with fasciclin (FAS1) repeats
MAKSSSVAQETLAQIAKSNKDFSTLVKACEAAGLLSALEGPGPFTVFAPTNEAFAKLPPDTIKNLLKPENKSQLADILKFHVIQGKVLSDSIKGSTKAKSLSGKELDISVKGSEVTVNGAHVIKADIVGSNGVIHVIDAVLIPKK